MFYQFSLQRSGWWYEGCGNGNAFTSQFCPNVHIGRWLNHLPLHFGHDGGRATPSLKPTAMEKSQMQKSVAAWASLATGLSWWNTGLLTVQKGSRGRERNEMVQNLHVLNTIGVDTRWVQVVLSGNSGPKCLPMVLVVTTWSSGGS